MVKEKNQNRVEAGKKAASKNKWIQQLKKMAKTEKIKYKDAMIKSKKTERDNDVILKSKKKVEKKIVRPNEIEIE